MSTQPLTDAEKKYLLQVARNAIETAVNHGKHIKAESNSLTPALLENGASFVTLTRRGDLRGCIGALEAYQPLVDDVIEHAVSAALNDPRFYPVQQHELSEIHIEISRLTPPQPLPYKTTEELPHIIRPHIDGVILNYNGRRATFLPQVWEQLPDPDDFLSHLCSKMGVSSSTWKTKHMDVLIYEVEEFHE
jgi:AmmeMemoRadiSam system protein A